MTISILGLDENNYVKNEGGAREMMGRSPEEWKGRRMTQVLLGSYSMYGLSVGTHVEIRRPLCSPSSLHFSASLGDQVQV